MRLSAEGEIAAACWRAIPEHFPNVRLDASVVMPNHVHGIVCILPDDAPPSDAGASSGPSRGSRGTIYRAPTRRFGESHTGPLATVVGTFKAAVTREVNRQRGTPGAKLWQRNYWERVLRDERELLLTRRYIEENPLRWHLDRENPAAPGPA